MPLAERDASPPAATLGILDGGGGGRRRTHPCARAPGATTIAQEHYGDTTPACRRKGDPKEQAALLESVDCTVADGGPRRRCQRDRPPPTMDKAWRALAVSSWCARVLAPSTVAPGRAVAERAHSVRPRRVVAAAAAWPAADDTITRRRGAARRRRRALARCGRRAVIARRGKDAGGQGAHNRVRGHIVVNLAGNGAGPGTSAQYVDCLAVQTRCPRQAAHGGGRADSKKKKRSRKVDAGGRLLRFIKPAPSLLS